MESIGARIKKLRLEKGISLDEVHKKTKIHLDILKAIEEDSFINLSPVYIKGFLKIYCKFLGVDARDYIPDYQEPQSIVRPILYTRGKPVSLMKTIPLKFVYLKSLHIKKVAFIVILISIFVIGLFNVGKIIFLKHSSIAQKAKLPAITAAKTENKNQITTSNKPKTQSIIRLGIHAKDDCWIRLKCDGKVIFQNVLTKGRSESWQAKEKIELSLGNAGAVDLEVNGKFISSLGRRGQPLKNILITKEGISIGR